MISSENEARLREVFTRAGADIAVPLEAAERLRARHYHPRQPNRRMVVGATAVAAAAGIVVPLAAVPGSPGAAPLTIRFDSYTFKLPAAYHAAGAGDSRCRPALLLVGPPPLKKGGIGDGRISRPANAKAMMTAATAAGGCIGVDLTAAYWRTWPDPVAWHPARQVRVGPYRAMIWRGRTAFEKWPNGPIGQREVVTNLYLQLPVGHGKVREFIAGSARLSVAALIRIVAHGLSSRNRS